MGKTARHKRSSAELEAEANIQIAYLTREIDRRMEVVHALKAKRLGLLIANNNRRIWREGLGKALYLKGRNHSILAKKLPPMTEDQFRTYKKFRYRYGFDRQAAIAEAIGNAGPGTFRRAAESRTVVASGPADPAVTSARTVEIVDGAEVVVESERRTQKPRTEALEIEAGLAPEAAAGAPIQSADRSVPRVNGSANGDLAHPQTVAVARPATPSGGTGILSSGEAAR